MSAFTSATPFDPANQHGYAYGQNAQAWAYQNDLSTASLIEKLTTHAVVRANHALTAEQRKKSAETLLPACVGRINDYQRDQLRSPKSRKGVLPSEKTTSTTRCIENIVHVTWLVIDYDSAPQADIDSTLAKLDTDDIYYTAHTTFTHNPSVQPKWRIWCPLDIPFCPQVLARDNPTVSEQAWRTHGWELVRSKFLKHYAPTSDPVCDDISRMFFRACRDEDLIGSAHDARVVRSKGTKCVSLVALMPNLDEIATAPVFRAKGGFLRTASKSLTAKTSTAGAHATGGAGKKHILADWIYRYGHTLDIERIFEEADDLVKSERSAGGLFVCCDIEDEHSDSAERTFVVNGSTDGSRAFVIYCGGATEVHGVACKHRDKLDRLLAYIRADLISIKSLQSADYGGGALPSIIFS
jgi:hypothetical protein